MVSKMTQLVWFRNDLRMADNPALYHALEVRKTVRCLYIHSEKQNEAHDMAPIQLDFIERQLNELAQSLAKHGVTLEIIDTEDYQSLPEDLLHYASQHGIKAVHFNRQYFLNEQRRDEAVHDILQGAGIKVADYAVDSVIEPGELLTGSGDMYKVFTPFSRAWMKAVDARGYSVYGEPDWSKIPAQQVTTETIKLSGEKKDSSEYPVGEAHAHERLKEFAKERLIDYGRDRDFPAINGTSQLSHLLAVGVLSANQCLSAIEQQLGRLPRSKDEPGFTWLNELIWRDFYRHLMEAFPHVAMHKAFKADTNDLAWPGDESYFKAWCEGKTGFPIIDAAMRCLNATGWMHNRLRMIVASFLTKDLHIDWRQGEQYFMRQLIDGDFASNNGGWQWAASTGADAAPYFRIFNPTTQSERYDKQGEFIKTWLPELKEVPSRHIHAPVEYLSAYDSDNLYPKPVVNHKLQRELTLKLFQEHKESPQGDLF